MTTPVCVGRASLPKKRILLPREPVDISSECKHDQKMKHNDNCFPKTLCSKIFQEKKKKKTHLNVKEEVW